MGLGGIDHIYDLPNPVVFTHGDTDGLSAAAIIVRAFNREKMDVEVVITQPFSLHNDLTKYDESCNVIIIDLAISNKTKDLLMPGTIIIDHHPSTGEYLIELEDGGMFVAFDLKKSASQLVYNIVGGGKIDKYISRLGAAGDWIITNNELGKQSTLLASSMSLIPDDDQMRYYILGNLVAGNTVWQMKEAARRSKLAFKKLDKIREEYVKMFEDDMFLIRFYQDGFGFASILANKLHKEFDKISFAMCPLDDRTTDLLVTARAPDDNTLDLRKIFKKFYDWGGYGGGHAKAASGVLPESKFFEFSKYLSSITKKQKKRKSRNK
jgi:single-stranded DNA-specific DHH superfamily exonuclease